MQGGGRHRGVSLSGWHDNGEQENFDIGQLVKSHHVYKMYVKCPTALSALLWVCAGKVEGKKHTSRDSQAG